MWHHPYWLMGAVLTALGLFLDYRAAIAVFFVAFGVLVWLGFAGQLPASWWS